MRTRPQKKADVKDQYYTEDEREKRLLLVAPRYSDDGNVGRAAAGTALGCGTLGVEFLGEEHG